ncbi:MAG TPA: DNA recombination protein RmuC [Verrucomicrobiae bacterium]|nr:DNA recombination protein RmuC [Verrucomicrobiae bacterium]
MTGPDIFLAVLLLAGFAVVIFLLSRRPESGMREQLAGTEAALKAEFNKATADMAARVEQVKGGLQLELGDRLQTGLKESRAELAQGLAQLSGTLQSKFEQLAESQAQSARVARGELAQSLDAATKTLQARFEGLEQKTSANLENIRAKVDEKLQSISEQVQSKLEKNIQEGFAHFKAVQEHLKAAEEQLRNVGAVGTSINELNTLLKLPHLRGKFGEAELSRLLADFLPAAAFEEQVNIVPGSREAVDAVVKFPKFKLPIDSKFNREAILPLFETNDPGQLAGARAQLATAIKTQAKSIAEKYIHPEHGTTDLALMFLPSETIYFEVIRDGELLAAIHKLNVFPVSPNTLVITLRSIAMSMSQFEFAKSVEKTLEQIRLAQKHFGNFQKKFEDVGEGLEKAQKAYAIATNHLVKFTNSTIRLTGEPAPELPAESEPTPTA